MMKFVALGLTSGLLGLFAAIPANACGGGSCGNVSCCTCRDRSGQSRSCQFVSGIRRQV